MAHHTDHELLAEFVKNGSESAFSALVARHVNLVYSTALRHTSNPHHAEEVTQAVFIILARKAGSISSKVVLSGWLYQTARLNAANHRRDNQRRQKREQRAIMESALNVPTDEPWKLIAPILDEAMNGLGVTDRDAVLLRYFENKPLAEVGAALGVSEAAAEKRVSRAVERLHTMLTRQGVALGATTIAGAIAANAVQAAPATLAVTITPAVLTATSLTSATVAMTTLQKIALTAVLAATIVGGIYAAKQASNAHKEVRELQAQQAPLIEQIRQLQSRMTDATNRLTDLTAENSELRSGKDTIELLKLRGEVTVMRMQLADLQKRGLEVTNGFGETLHVRAFRINPRAFLEKADSALGHPVNRTPTQITADYFASKGIYLEPPKSVHLNTSNALLTACATDPELRAIESLLAESTLAQINIKAEFIEIPRQGFVIPPAIPGMKDNKTTGITGTLSPAQLRAFRKALEQKDGFELLMAAEVTTLSGRQCLLTRDDTNPGQPPASGAVVDLIPNLSADGYTIKLKAIVSAPETLNGEVNLYDHQTLLLSTTEKSKPDSQLIVLLTATLVDAVGNVVHADDELPFAQNGTPPQN